MRKFLMIVVPAVAIMAAVVFSVSGSPDVANPGYFKNDRSDRVLAYQAAGPFTAEEARAILQRAPSTQGRVTVAVLYDGAAPQPGATLTAATDLAHALRVIGEDFPGWSYRLRINPAGDVTLDAGNT